MLHCVDSVATKQMIYADKTFGEEYICTKQRVLGITSQSSCCGHSLGKMFSVFLVSRNDAVRWIHSVR